MTLPPLPPPDTHCWDEDTSKDVWSYSDEAMRTYAEQAMAAERERCAKLAAEPVQEPLFWVRLRSDGGYEGPIAHSAIEEVRRQSGAWTPLYTSPQQRTPLSDDALMDIITSVDRSSDDLGPFFDVARAVEKALGDKHHDAPRYWFGVGHAPNFSRRVAQANESVKAAEKNLQEALRHAYPEGRRVTVIHHFGHFHGRVVGWDYSGCRVAVENERTLKVSKWWATHVQLCD